MNALIARLKLWQKFALVCAACMLLAVTASALVLQARYEALRTARAEQAGLKPAEQVLRLRLVQPRPQLQNRPVGDQHHARPVAEHPPRRPRGPEPGDAAADHRHVGLHHGSLPAPPLPPRP